jgi:hypothetical protein
MTLAMAKEENPVWAIRSRDESREAGLIGYWAHLLACWRIQAQRKALG